MSSKSRPVSQEISESTCKELVAQVSVVSARNEKPVGISFDSVSPDALTDDDDKIHELAKTMFEKTAVYLQGELSGTIEDYKVLEEMNKITITKYSDMKQIATNVSKSLKDLNEKYASLRPYLEQIEQIEASALKLEQAAYKLDAYSKRLEAKFKQLEKR